MAKAAPRGGHGAITNEVLEEMRKGLFTESLADSGKPRHGYIGFMGPLTYADGQYSIGPVRKRPVEKSDDGVDRTVNMLVPPGKKGKGPDVYFSYVSSHGIGDPFIDPLKRNARRKLAAVDPENPFRPISGNYRHSTNKLGYAYVPMGDIVVDPKALYEKNKGAERIRGVFTTGTKVGGKGLFGQNVFIGPFPEFMPDGYEGWRKVRMAEIQRHKDALARMEAPPFKGMIYGERPFFNDCTTYGMCDKCPLVEAQHVPRKYQPWPFKHAEHDAPFRYPSGPRLHKFDYIHKFPEWTADPVPQARFRGKNKDEEERQPWRRSHSMDYDNPQKSVALNLRNLRTEYRSTFNRMRSLSLSVPRPATGRTDGCSSSPSVVSVQRPASVAGGR